MSSAKRVRMDGVTADLKSNFKAKIDTQIYRYGVKSTPILKEFFSDYAEILSNDDLVAANKYPLDFTSTTAERHLENMLIVEKEAPMFLERFINDTRFRNVVSNYIDQLGDSKIKSDLELFSSDLDTWETILQQGFPLDDLEMLLHRPNPESRLIVSKAARQYRDTILASHEISVPVVPLDQQVRMQEDSDEFSENMTPEKIDAIKLQTSLSNGESQKINKYLRTGVLETWSASESIEDTIRTIDSILHDPKVPRQEFPVFVQRGINEKNLDFLNDPGYKSTSINPSVSLEFCNRYCVLLQILLEPGFPIFKVPKQATRYAEFEVLLSRQTRFQLMSGGFTVHFRNHKFGSGHKVRTLQVIRVRAVFA